MEQYKSFVPNDIRLAKDSIDYAKNWLDLAASVCEDSKTEEQLNKVIDTLDVLQISIDTIIAQWKANRTEAIA